MVLNIYWYWLHEVFKFGFWTLNLTKPANLLLFSAFSDITNTEILSLMIQLEESQTEVCFFCLFGLFYLSLRCEVVKEDEMLMR